VEVIFEQSIHNEMSWLFVLEALPIKPNRKSYNNKISDTIGANFESGRVALKTIGSKHSNALVPRVPQFYQVEIGTKYY
jgi:hypothetical protein